MRTFWALMALAALATGCTSAPAPDPSSLEALNRFAARADIRQAMIAANADASHDHCVRENAQWLQEYPAPPPNGMIAALLARPVSVQLAADKQASAGRLVQLMVMDKAGCLIAADAKTHDLDQSDEPKYQLTLGANRKTPSYEGAESRALGKIDQVSQALYDDKGAPLGVITLRWCPAQGGCG